MADTIFAEGFKTDPYWWEAAPRPHTPDRPLPKEADVLIVGSGYTGTAAALTLVRNGRKALILDAEDPGYGASSRNAGYVGRTLWHKFGPLLRKVGPEQARQLANQAVDSHHFLVDLIEKEQIACGFVYCSRFIAAFTQGHYEHFAADLELFRRNGIEIEADLVPRSEQRREIGSDRYHGGLLLRGTGALHPGLYHLGLLDRAIASGAEVMGQTRVLGVVREPNGGFTVTTSRGSLKARDVVIATCGYSDAGVPWMQRRIVPVKLFQAATEPLPAPLLNKLIPNGRTLLDSKYNIYWVRLSPDNTRLIVGGRTGVDDGGLHGKARKLHAVLTEIFPELSQVKFTHCWDGQTGFSFDKLPHIGIHDGMHYAMGYCGVGLPMGTYLGNKLGLKLLGQSDGTTPFDGRNFPTRPLYDGNPWFLPLMMGYYNTRDRIDQWRG